MASRKPSNKLKVSDAVDPTDLPFSPGGWGQDLVNPWAAPEAAPAEESKSLLRSAGDSAVAVGRGLTTGARLLANAAAGADSGVSKALKDAGDYIGEFESPQRRKQREERARLIKEAEESGSTVQEIGAYLGSLKDAPVDTILEALATSAPSVAAAAIPGAGPALAVGLGAAQGAGSVKEQIYDSTRQGLIEQGVDPAEAERRASVAQEYSKQNADQIGVGALLGGAAGRFGLESSAARIVGGKVVGGGAVRRLAAGAAAEGVPEALQGGQEQFAGNLAQQREGIDVPLSRGVAGSAALEGATGGVMGAGGRAVESAVTRPEQIAPVTDTATQAQAPVAPPPPPSGPLSKAASKAPVQPVPVVGDPVAQDIQVAGEQPAPVSAEPAARVAEATPTAAIADPPAEPVAAVPVEQPAAPPPVESTAPVEVEQGADGQVVEPAPLVHQPAAQAHEEVASDGQRIEPAIQDAGPVAGVVGTPQRGADNAGASDADRVDAGESRLPADVGPGPSVPGVVEGGSGAGRSGATNALTEPEPAARPLDGSEFARRQRFASVDEVSAHLTKIRRQSQSDVPVKPVVTKDGEFTFAVKGDPEFDALPDARGEQVVMAASGKPFRSKVAAERARKARPDAAELEVRPRGTGGFVMVRTGKPVAEVKAPARPRRTARAKARAQGETDLQAELAAEQDQEPADPRVDATPEDEVEPDKPAPAATEDEGAEFFDEATGPHYSRKKAEDSKPAGRTKPQVERHATRIAETWRNGPEIRVLSSIDEAPESVRKSAKGSAVEGWIEDGVVHLVADQLPTDADVERVMAHEALGHYGLQGVFGTSLDQVLDQIALARPKEIEAKAKAYGLDAKTQAGRRVAAEEVLANLAQSKPRLTIIRRAVAAVRQALRKMGFGVKWSDADIIAHAILPARRFVEQGGRAEARAADAPKFSKAPPTATAAFKRWFGKSKVVDASGAPMRVYHGTDADFTVFEKPAINRMSARSAVGFWFTSDRADADGYGKRLVSAYVAIKKPRRITRRKLDDLAASYPIPEVIRQLSAGGYDGLIVSAIKPDRALAEPGMPEQYVAFHPEQIKSVDDNNGEFDPKNPDIRFSLKPGGITPAEQTSLANGASNFLMQGLSDSRRNGRKFKWWRGINTQYHKATLDADFKRVYDAAQTYSRDVSKIANEAADLAPTLLPNIANLSDLAKKAKVSQKDLDVVSTAVFEGTLSNTDPTKGRVWTAAELRSKFQMTDTQIGLYEEFRAAVTRSLDDMGKAELIRFAGHGTPESVKARVLEAADVTAAAQIVEDHLRQEMANAETPAKARDIEKTLADIKHKAGRVQALKDGGYAPLMRFGSYAVWIQRPGKDDAGKPIKITEYFSTHDSLRDANRAAREVFQSIKAEHPDAELKQGLMSQEEHKLFAGVTPDTLEVFGAAAGFDGSPEWKAYVDLVKNNRSALKRLLERKGTAGYSQDLTRVLAGFVTSNARAAAGSIHSGEMIQAVEAIPQAKGDVKDDAVKLVEYLRNPMEEAPALRGLMFHWFIGGSIASAAVNLTQPLTMTLPYLSIKDGAVKALARISKASKDVIAGKCEPALQDALDRGEKEGIVEPQEIHALQAEVSRNLGSNLHLRKALFAWGYLFQAAERFNRRTTFVAAWRQAVEKGEADPFAAAEKAVVETQGVFNRGNRPNWARGPVAATLFTFKQYSIGYVEFVGRLLKNKESRPAGMLALGVLVALSGISGLPGAEDLDDIIDTIAQAAGYNFQTENAKKEFLASLFGTDIADFALHGVSTTGIPIDVQGRLGLGNLFPGTGAWKRSSPSGSSEAFEVLGAAGGVLKSASKAVEAAVAGDVAGVGRAMMPVAIANAYKMYDMVQTGAYRDTRGRRVVDASTVDAIWKGIGFQPAVVAAASRAHGDMQGSINIVKKAKAEITGQMADGLFEKDAEKFQRARAKLADWNRKNPETPITINQQALRKRVLEMNKTRAERIIKASPREMRGNVARALQED